MSTMSMVIFTEREAGSTHTFVRLNHRRSGAPIAELVIVVFLQNDHGGGFDDGT